MTLIPSDTTIESFRSDIKAYLVSGQTTANHTKNAIEQFKMDIKDKRGIAYSLVLNDSGDAYVADFSDRILWMLSHLTISLIFRDWAINKSTSSFWDLANEYEARYAARLDGTDFSSLTYSRPQMSFVVERS